MKYVVLIGDGMADRPIAELGGKTPLQAASTPNMDRLAGLGLCGMAQTVPAGYDPGSDVANMSVLGYDPAEYYSGRAPLEAASMGVDLAPEDVAFRCNLVTIKHEGGKSYMQDYSAGHITSAEAAPVIKHLAEHLKADGVKFYPGVSYRHLMVWRGADEKVKCTPPHDITGKDIAPHMPKGPGDDVLSSLITRSWEILSALEFNKERIKAGKNPANSVWFWGQGRKPRFTPFRDKFGVSGALVSAVDLMKGLAVCSGLRVLDVPGVTGYLDTNYEGKASYSLDALADVDFVYIHVEAPDEAGHMGKLAEKVRAIEDFDRLVVGNMIKGLDERFKEYRVLLMPDHPTPIEIKTHSAEGVPFVLYDSTVKRQGVKCGYSEDIAKQPGIMHVDVGHRLMEYLIKGVPA